MASAKANQYLQDHRSIGATQYSPKIYFYVAAAKYIFIESGPSTD
jgi:hypothetical protein